MLQLRAIVITSLLAIVSLLLLSGTGLWLSSAVAQSPVTLPEIPMAKGEQCVADTAFMRKNHMDVLNHQRDETVIDGIRGNPFSLVGCVDCHAQRDTNNKPIRIDAEGQFCESCHAFAAVKIDCFSCHAAVPEQSPELIGHFRNHRHVDVEPYPEKQSMISALSFTARERRSLSVYLNDSHAK